MLVHTKLPWSQDVLEFHLIISGYSLTPLNQECASNTIIENEDECKTATGQLNLPHWGTHSWSTYPKGCFKDIGTDKTTYTYWNPHSYGGANPYAQAICKEGKWFELLTNDLQYA